MGCPGGYGLRAFPGDGTVSESGARKDLFGLVSVFVDAGILEPTGFGGYKVAIDVRALQREVDLLRRKVAKLEAEKMLGPQEPSPK